MIEGRTPFYSDGMDQIQLFRGICKGRYKFPVDGKMSNEVKDLIERLFVPDPAKRIGALANGINEIYSHPWFKDIDFGKLRQKELVAPWVPEVKDPFDTTNFESWNHLNDKTMEDEPIVSAEKQKLFESFEKKNEFELTIQVP
mmetsp:Transcript_20382/g.44353  ORF Transcript_20382/g.44353 Transcript_20382/m.44353 type:complete len:143 (+) Transcript_20382:1512-1940(+)